MSGFDFASPAVAHGVGLFETMLVSGGTAVMAAAHHERLAASCRELRFPAPDREEFLRLVEGAAVGDASVHAALRVVWAARESATERPDAWSLGAHRSAIPAVTIDRRAGARLVLLPSDLNRSLPRHKTTSYLPCVVGLRRAIEGGGNEGVFVDRDGSLLEGTATNLFSITGDRLATPPSARILPGTVRSWVMVESKRLGITVEERPLTVDEVRNGSFVTGSLTGIAPVLSVDGTHCAPGGEVVETLSVAFRTFCGMG